MRWLEARLGRRASRVRECVFFRTRIDGFDYTVVDVWTNGDPSVRDFIYRNAQEFVSQTGWYPRAHGERLAPARKLRADRGARGALRRVNIGSRLVAVESAVASGAEGGVCLRVRTDSNSILLDAGFGGPDQLEPRDVVVLLSHAHDDHSGGLNTLLRAGLTAMTSPVTERLLEGRFDRKKRQLLRLVHTSGPPYNVGESIVVQPFAVPHMPGSLGFRLSDGTRTAVYTGDICLRTKRHEYLADLLDVAVSTPTGQCTVLLDGTMVDGRAGASRDDSARALLQASGTVDDLVVVADYPEQALYCYLDLFFTQSRDNTLRGNYAFVCTPGIRRLMELMVASRLARTAPDPFLTKQYGGNAHLDLWGESTLLYWTDTMLKPPSSMRRVWVTSRDELDAVHPRGGSGALVQIGRGETLVVERLAKLRSIAMDTSPWTIHSDQETIIDSLTRLSEASRVVLFHTNKRSATKPLRGAGLDAAAISTTPVLL